MVKIKYNLFFILASLMALVVALSNYLVQFPVNYIGLQDLLTYGAFSYPVAFLISAFMAVNIFCCSAVRARLVNSSGLLVHVLSKD